MFRPLSNLYVALDATDKALEFYPDFINWASQYKPATVS